MREVCKAYILHTFSILSVWFFFEAKYKKLSKRKLDMLYFLSPHALQSVF